ncbi:MAG: hypothetical protein RTU92_06420 [Candidatus Thorarchaeota archaeon]
MKSKRTTLLVLVVFSIALSLMPLAGAQSPEYELLFQATTPDSIQWNSLWLGMGVEPIQIYGNFSISLIHPENVSYVEFRVGDNNESDPFDQQHWDLVLNATSQPFSWSFNTLDYPVGLHSIAFTAFNTDGPTVERGGVVTLYFEHQDRSLAQTLYSGLSITLVSLVVCVTIIVIFVQLRKRPKRADTSRFERDVFHG